MPRTRKEKERAQKRWAQRRELLRFGYGKLAEFLVRRARRHYQDALLAYQKGKREEAEKALRQALEINPDAPDPLLMLGRILIETGREGEAIGVLSKAKDLDAGNPDAHYWFGRALEAAGRKRRAYEAYQRASEKNPEPSLAKELRERLRQLREDLEGETTPPEKAEAFEEALHWARFYLDIGFPRRSREYLRQAEEIFPDHPRVQALREAIKEALQGEEGSLKLRGPTPKAHLPEGDESRSKGDDEHRREDKEDKGEDEFDG